MHFDGSLFGAVLAALFAMMNPLANTPVFLGLTDDFERGDVRKLAIRSTLLAFVIGAAFVFCGSAILSVFGISISAFRIAGGVLVALVGYHLLQGQHSSVQKPSDEHLDKAGSDEAILGIAVSPLALPILAGPGTLVTLMNFSAGKSPSDQLVTLIAFAVICLLTCLCFLAGGTVTRVLGTNALMVVSRIMGLILTVIGVQMLIEGIKGAFSLT
ncbi:MAG: MarC family protein [Verrucomicrobiota bacterium]